MQVDSQKLEKKLQSFADELLALGVKDFVLATVTVSICETVDKSLIMLNLLSFRYKHYIKVSVNVNVGRVRGPINQGRNCHE